MVRHGSPLVSLAGALVVIAAALASCAPDPQKKHPISTMGVQTTGQAGGTPATVGMAGTAGVVPGPGGAAGDGGGSTGLGGDGGAAAGAGAAGDPGTAGTGGEAGSTGGAGTGGGAGAGGAGSGGAGTGGTAPADGGTAGTAARADASVGAADARAAETAAPPPPVNPCNRTTWTFVPSVVCTTACAGAAASTKDPANAIDGNPDTRYTTGMSQGSKGTETATLTFAAPVTIGGITLVSKGGDGPAIYRVDWSTDGTTFWNFEPPVTGLGSDNLTATFPAPKKVRGVRITQLGIKPTNWWSIHELGVVGCAP